MSSAEVQAAIDDLAERLQRSVVIDDVGFFQLYSSRHFGDEDPARIEAMLKRRADTRVIGHILATGVLTWTRPGVIPPFDEVGLQARMCVPIRWLGELIGFAMVMDSAGTVTTAETAAITDLAERIAPLLAGERTPTGGTEQTVLDLVGPNVTLRRSALAELTTSSDIAGLDTVTAIRLTVRPEVDGTSDAHITASLRIAVMLPKPTGTRTQLSAVADRDAVVVLWGTRPLSVESARTHTRRLLTQVNELSSGRFRAVAGIGPSLQGIDRTHETAELAELAMRAAVAGLVEDCGLWEELGPYGPLLRIPADQLTEQALPAEVRRLLASDQDGRLLATLRAYLDAAGSVPAASAALRVHRTTLYYRLSRIEELLDVDLSHGRTQLSLHLGIALLDLMPRLHGAEG